MSSTARPGSGTTVSEKLEGDVRVIDDFLPRPEDLVFKEENVKVRLGLSRRSVEFFKREAEKHHTQYQKMIRRLLDLYAARHQ